MAKMLSLNPNLLLDSKEIMNYIYKGYINSNPVQSNMFRDVARSYRSDFIDNTNNVNLQMEAMRSSLVEIYTRYGYTSIQVKLRYEESNNAILVDIVATDRDGVSNKLSDTVINE